uniref:Uncharacterized protein n=1 Tax=Nelumbo nucifera TaxID=4432 RepID=A0A822YUF9_NELNU|nr:TPA_asm: hypothetical protein HUJ06_006828 [Nelumbo nucifera]
MRLLGEMGFCKNFNGECKDTRWRRNLGRRSYRYITVTGVASASSNKEKTERENVDEIGQASPGP